MAKCECSFLGVGKFWYRVKGTNTYIEFGNVNEATFSADEERVELRDYESTGGGNCNVVSRLTTPQLTLTVSNLCPGTLAIGLRAGVTATAGGAQTDEAHTAYDDSLTQFTYLPDVTQSITVTGSGGTPTYVLDTDYTVANTGIVTLSSGSIGDGTAIEVDYTSLGTSRIESLINTASEYEIILDGINEAQSNSPFSVKFHKVKFSPLAALPFIATDDFATIELVGEVLADSTITSSTLSQYFTMSKKTQT